MQDRKEIIDSEVKNFFDNKYKNLFNMIKFRKWYTNKELNNYNESDFICEITKKKFCMYVNEISKILNDKNIKQIFKYFEYGKKKGLLDYIILFTFLMYEIIEDIEIEDRIGYYATYYILNFFEIYNKEEDNQYKYLSKICFDKKIENFGLFYIIDIYKNGNLFSEIFYDSFFTKDEIKIKVKEFSQSNEICGICLNKYNNDMISYCEIHYICFECYKEADVGKCINKCETKELIMYKKT